MNNEELALRMVIEDLELGKWVQNGFTISHWDGRTIFVIGGIPGEIVDIKIDKTTKQEWFGTVIRFKQTKSNRISVDCPSFLSCGGCSYRHISYQEELTIKKSLLADRFPKWKDSLSLISGSENHYRNNVQWKQKKKEVGFYKKGSHDIDSRTSQFCLTVDPRLLLSNLSKEIQNKIKHTKDILLRLSHSGISIYDREETEFFLKETIIRIPKGGFSQINQFLLIPWLDKICSYLSTNEMVAELFCGSGMIGLYAQKHIEKLIGLESHPLSIKFANLNASANNLKQYSYICTNLYKDPIPVSLMKVSTWIVNPPRSGLSKDINASIGKSQCKKLIYSSCNAATLQRDLIELETFGFQIEDLVLVDFFPRTHHFEVLALLVRD
ncbi:tRNA (Uracil-5-)-methyltransferase domain protein [Leptospira ryugenii]|uniref:tRNA (Uracil-5-)-methyltransferase domain protein n=1 Tax=Leptospira ryugenii TaxID=1917863 RepID=A0A2P2E363_9LEPT|nr:methyltransferase [Leptospira ryugenii]GBF51355.1 tRNA (Uracil-5-)-methyltransferase domain protein [Leptospira ryugenii]